MTHNRVELSTNASRPASGGGALFALGFRPLYLLAALGAAALLPLWLWVLHGGWVPASGLSPVLWHAHEMLFGVMGAVVVGFLFTAGKAWTGRATPRGFELCAFALLWVLARIAGAIAPYEVFAVVDAFFLPVAALRLAEVLWRAGNRRNLPIALVLALLGVANLVFHLRASGLVDGDALWALHAGLATLTLMETLIGGRIIPVFTRNATGRDIKVPLGVERSALLLTAAGLAAWLIAPSSPLSAVALAAGAAAQAARMWCWQPWTTKGRPILWALPLAYAWIPVGLFLLAVASWTGASTSSGVHALAVGGAGGLVIAMITRTARGHTGRPLTAGKLEVLAYLLVASAAVLRVGAPYLGGHYFVAVQMSAWLFATAFLIYVWVYAPWLTAPRADGRPD